MIDMRKLYTELKRDEGENFKPYIDTVGKTSIGVGRNLTDVGISQDECELMLHNDIYRTITDLNKHLPWWTSLNELRQRVIVNMAFNMGIGGLLTFKNTLHFMEQGDYRQAAQNMRLSKWYGQVGQRAERLCKMMENGHDV